MIILHAPLTDETRHLVDDAFLAGCARRPLIVNVSRGGLVDNAALLRALGEDRVLGGETPLHPCNAPAGGAKRP